MADTPMAQTYNSAGDHTGEKALDVDMFGIEPNIAVMHQVVNAQRAGPSTGMPTKTEQTDLLQAMFGRNGESPLAVVAPQSPADCFTMAIEATPRQRYARWRLWLKQQQALRRPNRPRPQPVTTRRCGRRWLAVYERRRRVGHQPMWTTWFRQP